MKKIIILSTALFLLLTSCKDFLHSSSFQTELENSVEWANAKSFDISIKAEPGTGTLGVPEIATVKIHDSFDLVFTEGHGYNFVEWQVYKRSDPTVRVEDCIEFKNRTALETKGYVLKYDEDLLIVPVCVSRDGVKIDFVSEGCFITPTDSKTYYLDDEFQLTYTPNYGYSFYKWEVIDNATNTAVTDVINITQEDGVWIAKVVKSGFNLTLKAVCLLRPKVVSKNPEHANYQTTFRNESIYITFNQPMSKNSISYTQEELQQLPEDRTILWTYNSEGLYCEYGYEYNNETVWKNISIVDLSDGNRNLLDCYDTPRFISDTTLQIPVNIEKLPPMCSDIYIHLSEKMTSETNLTMLSDEQWTYFISNENSNDAIKPNFEEFHLSSYLIDMLTGIRTEDVNAKDSSVYPLIETVKVIAGIHDYYFLQDGIIYLDVKVYDDSNGSGIQDFRMDITPYTSYTELLTDQKTYTTIIKSGYGVKKLSFNSWEVMYFNDIKNASNILCYKVKFTCFDKAGNEIENPKEYYLIWE